MSDPDPLVYVTRVAARFAVAIAVIFILAIFGWELALAGWL